MPMLEIYRDAIFLGERAPAGCSLLTQGVQTLDIHKNHKKVLGHMQEISRNVVFMGAKAPAGCSELDKGL